MRTFLTILLFSFLSVSLYSQFQYKFSSSNYTGETLIIGYYYGDKTLVKDTLFRDPKGNYNWEGTNTVSPGIYIGLLKPNNSIFQFIVNDENKFDIKFDTSQLSKIEVKGSNENKIFLDYVTFIGKQREKVEPLNNILKTLEQDPNQNAKADLTKKEIEIINNEVKNKQKEIVENYPNSLTAFLIKATNDDITFPKELEDDESEEGKLKKYLYYKNNFFAGIDFKNPMLINNNFFLNKMNNYFEKLVSPLADSIKKELDYIIPQMAGNEEALKFFLPHWISKYGNAKIIGHDAVYVHLIDNYFKKGWAPWSDPERMKSLYKYADDW
ncbi:MAG TPA: DUF5106 domain-containing protein, partial [Saprospiraceae bacterium]|nr:DUF5106 domain-containing protein [Saprospiraceae bacterium]